MYGGHLQASKGSTIVIHGASVEFERLANTTPPTPLHPPAWPLIDPQVPKVSYLYSKLFRFLYNYDHVGLWVGT